MAYPVAFSRVRATVAATVLVLGAGCAQQGGPPRVARPTPPPPTDARADKPAVALPVVKPTNRVAVLAPLTGPSAGVGRSLANAADMALDDLKTDRFTIAAYDTAGPGGAAEAARQAIAAGAKVIVGPLLAPDVRAAQPVADAEDVPILSFSNDAAVAGGNVYVLGYQPTDAVERLVRFARGRGVSSFAALTPAGAYGSRVGTAYLRTVESAGGRVTAVVPYTRDRKNLLAAARRVTDYDGRLARARGGKPTLRPDGTVVPATARTPAPVAFQAILVADSGAVAAAFAPALAQMGAAQAKILGTELWAAEPGLSRLPSLHGAWYAAAPQARFDALATRYRAKYGTNPSRLSSLSYDAVLLVGALADQWPVGGRFPVSSLRDPGGFRGIDGIFRFDARGIAERGYEVRQVGPGGPTVIGPAPASFGGAAVAVAAPRPRPLDLAA